MCELAWIFFLAFIRSKTPMSFTVVLVLKIFFRCNMTCLVVTFVTSVHPSNAVSLLLFLAWHYKRLTSYWENTYIKNIHMWERAERASLENFRIFHSHSESAIFQYFVHLYIFDFM